MLAPTAPSIVDGLIYLLEDSGDVVWRMPLPPTVIELDDTPALTFFMFRYPIERTLDGPVGGGVIHCALDLEAATLTSDRADLRVLTERGGERSLRRAAYVGGEVSLTMAGRRVAMAPIPADGHTVVALSSVVSPQEATQLSADAAVGHSWLEAVVDASVGIPWTGPETHVEVDQGRAVQVLQQRFGSVLTGSQIIEGIGLLVDDNVVRWSMAEHSASMFELALLHGCVAGQLFRPEAQESPLARMPGLTREGSFGFEPGATRRKLILRPRQPVAVRFFSTTQIPPLAANIPKVELPESRLRPIEVFLNASNEVTAAEMFFAFPDGSTANLVLTPETRATAYMVQPAEGSFTYEWRVRFTTRGGTSQEFGPYRTSDVGLLVHADGMLRGS